MNQEQMTQFMARNMKWIGWGNWTFAIERVKSMKDGAYAKIEPSEIGQQFVLTVPDVLMSMPEKQQQNILLHELVHGREKIKQDRVSLYCDVIKDREEELCVNDTTSLMQNWS